MPDTPTPAPTSTPAQAETIQEPAPTEAPHPQETVPAETKLQEAFVIYVVDGDTIDVVIDNVEYRVDYILIDAPETKHPDKPVEPFGPEAYETNKSLVEGKIVFLERDISDSEQPGQLLRYVYVDGLMVNQELLRLGLAQVAPHPPDQKYVDRFMTIQQEAQAARVGMWAE